MTLDFLFSAVRGGMGIRFEWPIRIVFKRFEDGVPKWRLESKSCMGASGLAFKEASDLWENSKLGSSLEENIQFLQQEMFYLINNLERAPNTR